MFCPFCGLVVSLVCGWIVCGLVGSLVVTCCFGAYWFVGFWCSVFGGFSPRWISVVASGGGLVCLTVVVYVCLLDGAWCGYLLLWLVVVWFLVSCCRLACGLRLLASVLMCFLGVCFDG